VSSSVEPFRRTRLPRLSVSELQIVARCTARVLRDSNRTLDIITAEEISAQTQLGALLDGGLFEIDDEARALFADRPTLADVDLDALRARDASTLGGAFARFLERHRLDYQLTRQPTPYTHDPDRAWLLHRLRQSHDLWHVLFGVGTRGHEEVLIHAFSLGQTGVPTSMMIVALGGLKHMVLERRWQALRSLRRAYHIGRQARPLLAVYWERHWDEPLEEIRTRYRVEPLSSAT
jgi:ubiquinone biosynthesis protein COQ4